ncbi:MAG: hypothetical protein M1832_001523 [Thelocarpon impressellum]|nr:MAG: hypothetical protein M1832_001523 [Thelocarpon impressellum]
MAFTRSTTGSSRPRVFPAAGTTTTTTTTKKTVRKGGASKANTSAPRTPATKVGRVTKAPAAHHKRKSSLKDKVEGVALKVEGKLTRQPGKKAAGTKKIRGTDGKNAKRVKV